MIVKVCGLREGGNIRAVEAAGADWFGFIFHRPSPRFVADVPSYMPQRGKRIGVFVKATAGEMLREARRFGLDGVQLYEATPQLCATMRSEGLIVVKALAAQGNLDAAAQPFAGTADYLLFDTPAPSYGGSGRRFPTALLQSYTLPVPFLLSGGIDEAAAGEIIALRHPSLAGVDINSRFETAPALKDAEAVSRFIKAIKTTDQTDQ